MQQRGCPPLPQHILEWQTPHLAKPPPEEEEDQDLDEEAAEAKQQEARLAVGEGLLGDLALVRTKRELSPSASEDLDEPTTKKQNVSRFGLEEAGSLVPLHACTADALSDVGNICHNNHRLLALRALS